MPTAEKAALTAWGSDKDLFARGIAELVTDDALTEESLASPGKVVRRLRGSAEEQIAALRPDRPTRRPEPTSEQDNLVVRQKRSGEGATRRRRSALQAEHVTPGKGSRAAAASAEAARLKPSSNPRPSRTTLDQAEQAMRKLEAQHAVETAELREREEALRLARREAGERQEREHAKAASAVVQAERAYHDALAAWAASGC